MTKENQQKHLTTKTREAISRLRTLSPKAQVAILLVVKEEMLKRRQAKNQSGQA